MGDYVGDPYPMQNFITIRLPLFAPQICENVHQVTRLVFWFFLSLQPRPAPIFTIGTSNDVVLRKDVPFGVSKNFYILTLFPPKKKTEILGQFSTGPRLKKALTVAVLRCKLLLIVIVAP